MGLKKAFDCVNIDILLRKLKYYGISETAMRWFTSYLKGRSQCVRIEDHISTTLPVLAGVPQGSVLGPTLFNIYINDFQYAHTGTSFQYADDTTILTENQNFDTLQSNTNRNLLSIYKWLSANLLALNLLKTVYMLITNKSRANLNLTIKLNNNVLTQVNSYKSLGLIIDDKLNFSHHCKKVCNSLAKINFMLFRNKYFLDKKSKLLLYYGLAYPHLTYNVALWGNAPAVYLDRVLISQKRVIRSIIGDRSVSATASFIDLEILNIRKIYQHQVIVYMFKIMNDECPALVCNTISMNQISHTYNTRGKNDLRTPFCSLAISQRAFSVQGPSLWNKIPTTLKDSNCTYKTFSKHLKELLVYSDL